MNPTWYKILLNLFLFSTCFGHPCAHHQEKLLYLCDTGRLSHCMGGVRSAGWSHSNQHTRRHPYRVTKASVAEIRSQSKKKLNIRNRASVSRRRMLATVVLCSGDFKLYFHTSHITQFQLVIELRGLE